MCAGITIADEHDEYPIIRSVLLNDNSGYLGL